MTITPTALAALEAKRKMTITDWQSLTPAEQAEFTDSNSDGVVNTQDILNVSATWGSVPSPTPPPVITPIPPSGSIYWIGANGTPYDITPVAATAPITKTTGIDATGQKDKTYTGFVSNPSKTFTVEGSTAPDTDGILVQNFGGEFRDYGAWVGGGKRVTFDHVNLRCINPAVETYGIRSYCDELVVMNSVIDNQNGWKRSVRIPEGKAAIINTTIIGGTVELGHRDDIGNTSAHPILFRNVTIEKRSDEMNMAARILNGAGDLVFDHVAFNGGGTAIEIQGTFTGKILCKNGCTRNGQPLTMSHIANDAPADRIRIEN
jgi:hypothetical protein